MWYGTGEGSVHSSVVAPSHGFAGAFSPSPRMHLITAHRNTSCDRPKPNAPIDETMFQSVNCGA